MRKLTAISLVALVAGVAMFGGSYTMTTAGSLSAESVQAMSLGDAWWDPVFTYASPGQYFNTEILLQAHSSVPIGAFTMEVTYDESVVKAVSWSQAGSEDITVNINEPGKVRFNGFSASGFPTVSGTSNIRTITIRWLAISLGTVSLSLTVETLGTTYGSEFDGWGRSGAVIVQW